MPTISSVPLDTTPPCDTVYCTEELGNEIYNAVILLLPCQTPAAVRLTLTSEDGKTILNETVDSSREITVPDLLGFTYSITLRMPLACRCSLCVCVCVYLTILHLPCIYYVYIAAVRLALLAPYGFCTV